MVRLTEKLLQLVRAEHAAVISPPMNVAPILRLIAADFGLAARRPGAPVPLCIDPDAFAVLARNLIENAFSHGSAPSVRLHAAYGQ